MRDLQGSSSVNRFCHHISQFGHSGVGVGGSLIDETLQTQPRLGGGLLKGGELATCFSEVSAQSLQVLLHELWALRKKNSPANTQDAIDQPIEDTNKIPADGHELSLRTGTIEASRAGSLAEV